MELKLIEDTLHNLSNEVKLLHDFISIKFGLDFEHFLQCRFSNAERSRSSPSTSTLLTQTGHRHQNVNHDHIIENYEPNPNQNIDSDNSHSQEPRGHEVNYYTIKTEDSLLGEEEEEVLTSEMEGGAVLEMDQGAVGNQNDEEFISHQSVEEPHSDVDSNYEPTPSRKRGRRSTVLKKKVNNKPELDDAQPGRKIFEYEECGSFNSLEEAKQSVCVDWTYHKKYRRMTDGMEILRYVCRQSARCASKRTISYYPNSGRFIVEKTVRDHDHEEPIRMEFPSIVPNKPESSWTGDKMKDSNN